MNANCAGGMQTYKRYASLFHLPSVQMSKSSVSAAAAVEAALIRKL